MGNQGHKNAGIFAGKHIDRHAGNSVFCDHDRPWDNDNGAALRCGDINHLRDH